MAPLYLLAVDAVRVFNAAGVDVPFELALGSVQQAQQQQQQQQPRAALSRAAAGLAANAGRIAATVAFTGALVYWRLGYLTQGCAQRRAGGRVAPGA